MKKMRKREKKKIFKAYFQLSLMNYFSFVISLPMYCFILDIRLYLSHHSYTFLGGNITFLFLTFNIL